ncbi:MAG: DoxX family protein [Anaerolineae bacterium]
MAQLISLNSLAPLASLSDIVLLVVRLIFGITFIYYGRHKIKDLKSNANDFVQMGFKPGWLWGTIVALQETVGSLMVILGIFTWLAAIGFVVHMALGAIWKITKTDKPFTDWSYDLLLLSIALLLLVTGPGAYNLLLS